MMMHSSLQTEGLKGEKEIKVTYLYCKIIGRDCYQAEHH